MAPWETTTFEVEHWIELMDEVQIDLVARRELFLLSQFGTHGPIAANNAISKILKMQSEQKAISNWSAWFHKICLNARYEFSVWDNTGVGNSCVCGLVWGGSAGGDGSVATSGGPR